MSNLQPDTLNAAINAGEKVLQNTPIYQDAIQPVAKEVGRALGTVGKTINMALAPLSGMIWCYEKIADHLTTSLENKFKTKNIPLQNIITPDPAIAGPLVQNFQFIAEKPALREMYTNLLATAMNKDTASIAHPSYTEIIKQLTPDEAKIIKHSIPRLMYPIINISKIHPNNNVELIKNNVISLSFEAKCTFPQYGDVYITNLQRFGLTIITFEKWYNTEDKYNKIKNIPYVRQLISSVNTNPFKAEIQKGIFYLSPLGMQFKKACT